MRRYSAFSLFFLFMLLAACSSIGYRVDMDSSSSAKVRQIITADVLPRRGDRHGEIVRAVSRSFLGTPYQANTLIGSDTRPEQPVVNLNGVDCFTLLDYVHALSYSQTPADFLHRLVQTRYREGRVSFATRKHFFTDWFADRPQNAEDVTARISSDAVTVQKHLNLKADGSRYLPGLAVVDRRITYIPADRINNSVLNSLRTGDYIGIYSDLDGLDVSHVGIAVRKGGKVYYRNASSLSMNRKVVDTLLADYIRTRPGIVVLRAAGEKAS